MRFSLPWTISILSSSSFAPLPVSLSASLSLCLLHQFYWLFPSFHSIECTISLAGVPHAAVSLSGSSLPSPLLNQLGSTAANCSRGRTSRLWGQSIVFGDTNCCHNLPMNMGPPLLWDNRINNSPDTSSRAKSFNLIKPVTARQAVEATTNCNNIAAS